MINLERRKSIVVERYCYIITYKGGASFRIFVNALPEEKESFEHFINGNKKIAFYEVYLLSSDI